MNTIGKNIRALRHQKRWTQSQVAIALGVTIPAYSKMETGGTDINITRLHQLSDIYEVSPAYIISENPGDYAETDYSEKDKLQAILASKDAEILKLQKLLISLFEEVKKKRK